MNASLVWMSLAFATSNVARSAIAFVTSLVIARGLGMEGFGLWTLCTAWAAVLTVACDLGFGVLLTRDAARDAAAIGRVAGTALIVRLGVLLPVAALFIAAAPALATSAGAAGAMRAAALLAVAGATYSCVAPVFQARPRPLVALLSLETASALMQCLAAWWLIRQGAGAAGLIRMAALAQVVQLCTVALMWRLAAWLPPVERPSAADVRGGLRRALPFAAAGAIANAQLRIAPVLLGALSGAEAVAAFGAAFRLGNLLRLVPQAAFAGALPAFSRPAGADRPQMRRQFDAALGIFAVGGAAGLALGAAPLVRATYGDAFAATTPALVWVAIGFLPGLVNSGRKVFLYGTGGEASAVRWSAAALAVQTISCVLLIPPLGAVGAAAALAVGEAAVWLPLQRCVKAFELPRAPVGVVRESPLAG